MDIRKVKKLIEMLEESNLNEIEIKEGEEAVKLVKSNPVPSNFISSTPAIISVTVCSTCTRGFTSMK